MKILFLKSNLLHIRIKELEYLVKNPWLIGYFDNTDATFVFKSLRTNQGYIFIRQEETIEWPYGVELIEIHDEGRDMSGPPYPIVDFKTVARLIPEEKKELNDKTTSTSVVQEGNGPNTSTPPSSTAHSFTESAYKEGEKCTTCGKAKEESHYCSNSFHLSAPSESQEELWAEVYIMIREGKYVYVTEKFTIHRKPE